MVRPNSESAASCSSGYVGSENGGSSCAAGAFESAGSVLEDTFRRSRIRQAGNPGHERERRAALASCQ